MTELMDLTAKQAMFCELVAAGNTYSDAYREAYDAHHWQVNSVNTAAYQMMQKPEIRERVEELKQHSRVARKSQDKLIREWVLVRLRYEAIDKNNPGATRVRALQLIGADAGMWERKERDGEGEGEDMSPEDAERALAAFLRERMKEVKGKAAVAVPAKSQGNDIGDEGEGAGGPALVGPGAGDPG